MPDNPDIASLVARAGQVKGAQDKLRAAMAQVAAEKVTTPAPPAGGGGAARDGNAAQ